jgi:hypothetical protein
MGPHGRHGPVQARRGRQLAFVEDRRDVALDRTLGQEDGLGGSRLLRGPEPSTPASLNGLVAHEGDQREAVVVPGGVPE